MTEGKELETMEIQIEPAAPDDAAEMLELQYQAALETAPLEESGVSREDAEKYMKPTAEKIAEYAKEIEQEGPHDRFFVAVEGHRVVGRCRLTWHPKKGDEALSDLYQFREFFVRPGYMGRKIGKKLWEEALQAVEPTKRVFLKCNIKNEKAIKMYERWGFKKSGVFREGEPFAPEGTNRLYVIMVREPRQQL